MADIRLKLNKLRREKELKRLSFVLIIIVAALTTFVIGYFNHISKNAKAVSHISVHATSKANPSMKKMNSKWEEANNNPAIYDYLKSINFTGTAIVVKDNKVLLNKGFGYADLEKKIPNNPQTVHYIGSITKVFISTSIMQLQEQGKLNINDPLSKYIPDFPNGNQITLYHLLTHTSGIPEHSETAEKISHEDLMKKIEKKPLKFQPGTNWLYSDSNYAILAYILEKVTKVPLDTYVKKHVFDVAGMDHSGFGTTFNEEPFPSKGYKVKDGTMISPSLPDMSQLFGCGDVYTTAYDMYLFDHALYTGKLMSEKSLKQFFTPFQHNYALGLYSDPGSYSDHGVLPGWNCLNSFSKNGNTYVVLLSNVQNGVKLGPVNNQLYLLARKSS
ncbi:serine hydrolase domain-containing protein [Neobacillus sp. PS3-12]|uniref:serine hydrolase domain-containing protein n=1 Tax=Neobacillus sp. PS3-12 TaxID=3070677 RepID=UPI0027E08D2B|nr:serine hydrolase domain-containing protein [Neobacillus sp. PS3-12]WML54806.1 serine hydrolase domain-containing protein [Neobacillus sp. PS3-12]